MCERERLPDEREGVTRRFEIHGSEAEQVIICPHCHRELPPKGPTKGYLTVSYYADGRPAELFVRLEKRSSTTSALLDAWATAVSIGLQYGIPIGVYLSKCRGMMFPPRGFCEDPDVKSCSSPLDWIARWFETRKGEATNAGP